MKDPRFMLGRGGMFVMTVRRAVSLPAANSGMKNYLEILTLARALLDKSPTMLRELQADGTGAPCIAIHSATDKDAGRGRGERNIGLAGRAETWSRLFPDGCCFLTTRIYVSLRRQNTPFKEQ
jgi:hypothetical protein